MTVIIVFTAVASNTNPLFCEPIFSEGQLKECKCQGGRWLVWLVEVLGIAWL